jgi:hypothetical protein
MFLGMLHYGTFNSRLEFGPVKNPKREKGVSYDSDIHLFVAANKKQES